MQDDRTADLAEIEQGERLCRLLVLWEDKSLGIDLPARGELRVGRAKECDVVVDHASVSRSHVVIELGGERPIVRDLGSQNGTVINGTKLSKGEAAPFPIGTMVQIGVAILLLSPRGSASDPEEPAPASVIAIPPLPGLVVPSDGPMHSVYRLVAGVAQSKISVLLLGETGVGKEIVCEAIHRWSSRAEGPFVRLNCSAFAEQLLESELFGHERGAFTGAIQAKEGLIEAADRGTLFLDELGEMPLATQAKLLRVLEAKEVLRVGATKPRPVDVRVVAATHRDLDAAIRQGAFRSDLYYRLNGVTIRIPPLRERTSEIVPLAELFARRACEDSGRPEARLAAETIAVLRSHTWPGNVRELRNVIERAVTLCSGSVVEPRHLLELASQGPAPAAPSANEAPATGALSSEIADLEKKRILDALERNEGNQSRAAVELGMPRRTLVRRLSEYGITTPRRRS